MTNILVGTEAERVRIAKQKALEERKRKNDSILNSIKRNKNSTPSWLPSTAGDTATGSSECRVLEFRTGTGTVTPNSREPLSK